MGRRILDTNVLINHLRLLPPNQRTVAGAKNWAARLIDDYDTDFISSPVLIEFLCGARSGEELEINRAYLGRFRIVDEGNIPRQDWLVAERLAKRVGRNGRRRKLGDCLIRAISQRLRCEIITSDRDFEQRVPPSPIKARDQAEN